jgi:Ala-tRNA(Pro) deacylase
VTTPPPPISEPALLDFLAAHGVAFERFDHAPVFTCGETVRHVPAEAAGVQTKNLFLRDKRGKRHWLVVTSCEKAVDLRALGAIIGGERLGLASPDRLLRHLGVTPGAVTILGLVNDTQHAVELVIDEEVWNADALRVHPLVNSATLVIPHDGIARFLAATGHTPRMIDVPGRHEPPLTPDA